MKTKKILPKPIVGFVLMVLALFMPLSAAAFDLDFGAVEDAFCDEMESDTGGILNCGDNYYEITSFTEYQGSFEAPDAAGYDPGLTKAKSAREFILNVTNFALSFLGLIAIIFIIYGGFMYVTAGGKDEQMEKGKKSVMYAVAGIIVVLSSYAIVNTLIGEAAGGGEDRGQGGVYSAGEGVTGEEADIYNVNAISNELQAITRGYLELYTIYSNVYQYIDFAEDQPYPNIESVVTIGDTSGYDDEEVLRDVQDHALMIKELATDILDMVDRYSETYDAALELQEYSSAVLDNISEYYNYNLPSISFIPKAYAYSDSGDLDLYEGYISNGLTYLKEAAAADYEEGVIGYEKQLITLQSLFDLDLYVANTDDGSGSIKQLGSTLTAVNQKFVDILGYFMEGGDARQDNMNEFVDNSVLRDIVQEMGEIYAMVENLDFATSVITASVREENAPAVISFNGLSSYDPSDKTIQSYQYHWDLDGDGEYNELGDTECQEVNEPTVSCTYRDTGTYRVGLRILSSDENIGPGQSYVSVTVQPPTSQIVLTAKTGSGKGDSIKLADYSANIDRSKTKFTLVEGVAGITMDMEGTLDGNGDATISHKLNCGNGEEFESESLISETCVYTDEGSYDLSVEVRDVIGNTDRYLGKIVIASPAARIIPSATLLDIGGVLGLDGSSSTTDTGSIIQYDWFIVENGVEEGIGNGSESEHQFARPGEYTVSLEVLDSAGEIDIDSVDITVDSQPPVAKFTYEMPDPTQPGTVHFDASDSYDPDQGDVISYKWEFEGEEGKDFEYVDNTDENSEKPIVKFSEAGEKSLILGVSDDYENENLKKTTTLEGKFEVDSVLDVYLNMPSGVAYQLEETGVVVTFSAQSENAVAFEIDYDDGDSDVTESIIGNNAFFTHTYSEAGTYRVQLTAYDEQDNENYYTKKVYIGDADSPIAVIQASKDGNDVASLDAKGNINTVFTFNAGQSKNTDGSSRKLDYSWDLGDNTNSTEKKVTHTYDEVGKYIVTLTVTDEDDPTATSKDTFNIEVSEEPPVITGLSYQVTSDTLVTPVDVNLRVDASDPDGSITNYYWYYYDINNSTQKLGAQITTDDMVSITIPTRGNSGESKTYAFVVEITDTGNNTVTSADTFDEDEVPVLKVTNGQNAAPIAEFSVSDTLIMLGETVTLASSSYDPDGDDMMYVWDIEGDGFHNNEETGKATITLEPEQVGCFEVRLKVIDEKEQASVAPNKAEICVETLASAPEAAFTYTVDTLEVNFNNKSTADEDNGAEIYAIHWDFDTDEDSNGNGDTKDDIDSQEETPTHTYSEIGSYGVKLTAYDNAGGIDEVEHTIIIAETEPPTAAFTYEAEDLSVAFKNNSQSDGAEVQIVSHVWDFNTDVDSDGDGDNANDEDSYEENPTNAYDNYGDYTVKLTVLDSMNKEDFVTRTVELTEQQELIGYILTNPVPSVEDDHKIYLPSPGGYIQINYSTNRDSGDGVTCWLDKNVYYDTDGDGVKNNDHDYEDAACMSGVFSDVYFEESWGLVVMQFTVEDEFDNHYDITKEILFQNMGGANLFPVSGSQGFVLMIVALSFALLGASIYTVKRIT
ncbi:MAG: PKD domain-containing protein [Patescibacteria group bacterium]|nr:PKD domain-containing protein [Patescibacteria group bacterium]